jgi:serine kinase of HPr protein (carbohydrate metabolism regulator)
MIVHAGLVATRIEGHWLGVLIEGPSGAGKSDLALRAIDRDFRLVSDDRTILWVSEGRLFGRAPDPLSGLLEVRGLDILGQEPLPLAEVALIAVCGPANRMPGAQFGERLGVQLPLVAIAPLEASAPVKLGRALRHLGHEAQRAYQARLAARSLP